MIGMSRSIPVPSDRRDGEPIGEVLRREVESRVLEEAGRFYYVDSTIMVSRHYPGRGS